MATSTHRKHTLPETARLVLVLPVSLIWEIKAEAIAQKSSVTKLTQRLYEAAIKRGKLKREITGETHA